MAELTLNRCRILVAEDEYLLADEMTQDLADAGADVIGPAASVRDAIGLLEETREVDGAILDINLGGELVFPVADALHARNVPIVFTTGYDAETMPARYARFPRCEKPISVGRVLAALTEAIHA